MGCAGMEKISIGHILVYGNCSKTVYLAEGDTVKFEGYLKDGIIHGLSISQ